MRFIWVKFYVSLALFFSHFFLFNYIFLPNSKKAIFSTKWHNDGILVMKVLKYSQIFYFLHGNRRVECIIKSWKNIFVGWFPLFIALTKSVLLRADPSHVQHLLTSMDGCRLRLLFQFRDTNCSFPVICFLSILPLLIQKLLDPPFHRSQSDFICECQIPAYTVCLFTLGVLQTVLILVLAIHPVILFSTSFPRFGQMGDVWQLEDSDAKF